MLWRARATLPDRPGALAALARECGDAGVNIVGFQAFPDAERVTDELVVRTPDRWAVEDLVALVERAGAQEVVVVACSEQALADQPTRYVEAARSVLAHPASFPEVVAHLFDADVRPGGGPQDVMEMSVGEVLVQVRRTAPFTAVERARATAMADRRLLGEGARLASGLGADEVVLTTVHDNRAVMPMLLAAGLRGRIRMAGETLTVRISVTGLRPRGE